MKDCKEEEEVSLPHEEAAAPGTMTFPCPCLSFSSSMLNTSVMLWTGNRSDLRAPEWNQVQLFRLLLSWKLVSASSEKSLCSGASSTDWENW